MGCEPHGSYHLALMETPECQRLAKSTLQERGGSKLERGSPGSTLPWHCSEHSTIVAKSGLYLAIRKQWCGASWDKDDSHWQDPCCRDPSKVLKGSNAPERISASQECTDQLGADEENLALQVGRQALPMFPRYQKEIGLRRHQEAHSFFQLIENWVWVCHEMEYNGENLGFSYGVKSFFSHNLH